MLCKLLSHFALPTPLVGFLSRYHFISVLCDKSCDWLVSPRNVRARLRLESGNQEEKVRTGCSLILVARALALLSVLHSPTGVNPRHLGGRDGDGSLPCCPRRSQPSCKCGEVPCVPTTALALRWEGAGKGWGLPSCFLIPLSSLLKSRAGCVQGSYPGDLWGAMCSHRMPSTVDCFLSLKWLNRMLRGKLVTY